MQGRQFLEDPVDLLGGRVVTEADANRAAGAGDPEAVVELDGVVMAVPREDPAAGEDLRDLQRMPLLHTNGERRRSPRDPARLGDAEETNVPKRAEPAEEPA